MQQSIEPNGPIDLTFDLAEEIAEIGSLNSDVISDILPRLRTPSLSATIRLAKICGVGLDFLAKIADVSQKAASILSVISGGHRDSTSLDPAPWEVMRIPPSGGDENPVWQAFVWRLRRGAACAGNPATSCDAFAHAMIELVENVIEHSEHPSTGLAYYEKLHDRFEFGVADSGIGMLPSIRRNPAYAHLSDDLAAIRKSVEDGVSRFEGQGRGWGFRTIFRSVRNSDSQAMIRSGTAGLRIHPRDRGHDRIGFQRGRYHGLWVSVAAPTR